MDAATIRTQLREVQSSSLTRRRRIEMKQERACLYCIGGAAVNFSMLPLALPDAASAARSLLGSTRGAKEAR
ncbi:MAG: hypothetical protein M3Y59_07920 [Myxococcota bacterium]|nr:hypothetical protein [Myxococcota bacterium]